MSEDTPAPPDAPGLRVGGRVSSPPRRRRRTAAPGDPVDKAAAIAQKGRDWTGTVTMWGIPRAPLFLGLAGLLPFLWGTATLLVPALGEWAQLTLGGRFTAPFVQLAYGTVILSFMSGVLWGFATKGSGWAGYALSVIPALWAFFMVGGGPVSAAMNLCIGFLALLLLDLQFWQKGLAPDWWMKLRGLLTAIVVLSYLPLIL